MNKQEIKYQLSSRYQSFADYMRSLNQSDFLFSFQNKWTAGQQLDHICRATAPLPLGLSLPKIITRLFFGIANRPSSAYGDLVKKYIGHLEQGAKASRMYIPNKIELGNREKLISRLLTTVSKVNTALDHFTEDDLDQSVLPHPILGKLTVREMMYFTIYHVDHHKEKTIENLEAGRRA